MASLVTVLVLAMIVTGVATFMVRRSKAASRRIAEGEAARAAALIAEVTGKPVPAAQAAAGGDLALELARALEADRSPSPAAAPVHSAGYVDAATHSAPGAASLARTVQAPGVPGFVEAPVNTVTPPRPATPAATGTGLPAGRFEQSVTAIASDLALLSERIRTVGLAGGPEIVRAQQVQTMVLESLAGLSGECAKLMTLGTESSHPTP